MQSKAIFIDVSAIRTDSCIHFFYAVYGCFLYSQESHWSVSVFCTSWCSCFRSDTHRCDPSDRYNTGNTSLRRDRTAGGQLMVRWNRSATVWPQVSSSVNVFKKPKPIMLWPCLLPTNVKAKTAEPLRCYQITSRQWLITLHVCLETTVDETLSLSEKESKRSSDRCGTDVFWFLELTYCRQHETVIAVSYTNKQDIEEKPERENWLKTNHMDVCKRVLSCVVGKRVVTQRRFACVSMRLRVRYSHLEGRLTPPHGADSHFNAMKKQAKAEQVKERNSSDRRWDSSCWKQKNLTP